MRERFIIFISLIFLILNTPESCSFNYVRRAIPLVSPDTTNTKLIIHDEALGFLQSFNQPIAIISVAGQMKSGKSFLLNNILGLTHVSRLFEEGGFPVSVNTKPGTKGILLWGTPFNLTSDTNQENYTVIFMDTEGIGAPGSPAESYDPKLCTLTMVLSSLFMYNLQHHIQTKDITLLHSVVALSQLFESKLNQSFPFPKMMWIVQQFEHDLEQLTPEQFLLESLQEKENPENTLEIQKYNETVRVVSQFPKIEEPRILLMSRPHTIKMHKLRSLPFEELDQEYREQIELIRHLITSRLEVKKYNGLPVNGAFLAKILQELVPRMNEINAPYVGETFVRELTAVLQRELFQQYLHNMRKLPLPEDEQKLKSLHEQSRHIALNTFQQNCTGGLEYYDNQKLLTELKEMIDLSMENYLRNNTFVSHVFCSNLLKEIFKPLRDQKFYRIDEFEGTLDDLVQLYYSKARGPERIIQQLLEQFKEDEVSLKRELVLRESAHSDFQTIALILIALTTICFIGSKILISSTLCSLLSSICSISLMLLLLVIIVFHNFIDIDQYITFADIQYIYGFIRSLSWNLYRLMRFTKPTTNIMILSPLKRLFIPLVFIILIGVKSIKFFPKIIQIFAKSKHTHQEDKKHVSSHSFKGEVEVFESPSSTPSSICMTSSPTTENFIKSIKKSRNQEEFNHKLRNMKKIFDVFSEYASTPSADKKVLTSPPAPNRKKRKNKVILDEIGKENLSPGSPSFSPDINILPIQKFSPPGVTKRRYKNIQIEEVDDVLTPVGNKGSSPCYSPPPLRNRKGKKAKRTQIFEITTRPTRNEGSTKSNEIDFTKIA